MSRYHITTGRMIGGLVNKHYRANGETGGNDAIYAATCTLRAFDTLEELGAILAEVGNDPHAFLVMGMPRGIADGQSFELVKWDAYCRAAGIDPKTRPAEPMPIMIDGKPTVARTKEFWLHGGVVLLDRDEVPAEGWNERMEAIHPGLGTCGYIETKSNSARVLNGDCTPFAPSKLDNVHRYCLSTGISATERNLGARLKCAAMRAGQAWSTLTESGKRTVQVPFDAGVFTPERVDYAGQPTHDGSLIILPSEPRIVGGPLLDLSTLGGTEDYGELARALGVEGDLDADGESTRQTDLTLDLVLETEIGLITVAQAQAYLKETGKQKLRCQVTPWRPSSRSENGVITLCSAPGGIEVYDNGTSEHHYLAMNWAGQVPGSLSSPPEARNPNIQAPPPPTTAPSERVVESWDDVLTTPEYVIPMLLGAQLSAISGYRGQGKTALIVALALHVAGLKRMPGIDCGPVREVVIFDEDVSQIKLLACATSGLPPAELSKWVHLYSSQQVPGQTLAEDIKKASARYSRPDERDRGIIRKPWVVVDTVGANLALESFNDNEEVRRAVIALRDTEVPTTMICHLSKGDKSGTLEDATAAGGASWEGDSQQVFVFGKGAGDTDRRLYCTKTRIPIRHTDTRFGGEARTVVTRNEYGEEIPCEVTVCVSRMGSDGGMGAQLAQFAADIAEGKELDRDNQKIAKSTKRARAKARRMYVERNERAMSHLFKAIYPWNEPMRPVNTGSFEDLLIQKLSWTSKQASIFIEKVTDYKIIGEDPGGNDAFRHPLEARRPANFGAWMDKICRDNY